MYFQGKKSVTSTIMLCKDDTLDKENVFMIFDEFGVRNSPLQILFLWTQLFLKISLSTSSTQQVSCLHYMSQTTVLHMWNMNKQTKSYPFLFTFSTLELSNTTNMNKHKIKKHKIQTFPRLKLMIKNLLIRWEITSCTVQQHKLSH